jgi:hypothetical protein
VFQLDAHAHTIAWFPAPCSHQGVSNQVQGHSTQWDHCPYGTHTKFHGLIQWFVAVSKGL